LDGQVLSRSANICTQIKVDNAFAEAAEERLRGRGGAM
jgi:hypothetical protein